MPKEPQFKVGDLVRVNAKERQLRSIPSKVHRIKEMSGFHHIGIVDPEDPMIVCWISGDDIKKA